MDRAPGFEPGGWEFDSFRARPFKKKYAFQLKIFSHIMHALVAQWIERQTTNLEVESSILSERIYGAYSSVG